MRAPFRFFAVAAAAIALATAKAAAADPERTPEGPRQNAACETPLHVDADSARKVADELFERGKNFREHGRVADACLCFDASNRLAPARGGTMLSVGICHRQQGKLAAAYGELQQALSKARQDNRPDRESMASEHLAEIERTLAWLVLTPPSNLAPTAVTLKIDGSLVERGEWAAVPVDVGKHVVSASSNGFRDREMEVVVGEAERRAVRLEPLEPNRAPAIAASPTGPLVAATSSTPRAAPRSESPPRRGGVDAPRTAALVAGIAGMALSLGAGAWALERKGVVRAHCDADKQCDSAGASAASTGRALIAVSTTAFAGGALGFGVWALLLPGGPMNHGQSHEAHWTVRGVF